MRLSLATAIVALVLAGCTGLAVAQAPATIDSAGIALRIADEINGSSLAARARLALLKAIRSGEFDRAAEVLDFMDLYAVSLGASDWITPAERLLSETLQGDPRLVVRASRLKDLLYGWRSSPHQHPGYHDDLHARLRDLLRVSVDAAFQLLDRWRLDPEDRFFFLILVNHLTIQGIRGREQLNNMIDSFAVEYPESPLAGIARDAIRFTYRERPIGAAIHVGYEVGLFDGALGKRFRRYYGPVIAGEFFAWEATIGARLSIGLADGRESFRAGGEAWPLGEASLLALSLDAGYEIRLGRLAFTPMAGVALQHLQSADSVEVATESRPSSGTRIGYDLAVQTTYRIAFDRGPHVDLRIRLGRSDSDLEAYDAILAGGLWYVGLGIAIVHRPYIE